MPDEPDMNIISNRVVEFVNASNDFLFAKELQITCDEGSPANAQQFIDDTWGRKETRIPFLLRLGLNGAMASSPFLRIFPRRKKGNFPLVAIDPCLINIKTAPQDFLTVFSYCIE